MCHRLWIGQWEPSCFYSPHVMIGFRTHCEYSHVSISSESRTGWSRDQIRRSDANSHRMLRQNILSDWRHKSGFHVVHKYKSAARLHKRSHSCPCLAFPTAISSLREFWLIHHVATLWGLQNHCHEPVLLEKVRDTVLSIALKYSCEVESRRLRAHLVIHSPSLGQNHDEWCACHRIHPDRRILWLDNQELSLRYIVRQMIRVNRSIRSVIHEVSNHKSHRWV
jgi:hypothetical protein